MSAGNGSANGYEGMHRETVDGDVVTRSLEDTLYSPDIRRSDRGATRLVFMGLESSLSSSEKEDLEELLESNLVEEENVVLDYRGWNKEDWTHIYDVVVR